MTHYSDDDLAWHSLKPSPEIAAHLDECSECSARYEAVVQFDASLTTGDTWTYPRNLRSAEDPTRGQLREIASRLGNETAEAERSLGPLIANPLPFIWKDVSRKRGFRTAGAVRVLCGAANSACERDPLHALNLAARSARPIEAEKCADEAAGTFEATGDLVRYLHARMLHATVRFARQDFAGARDDYRALLTRAHDERDDLLVARLCSAVARCELELGDAKAAEPALIQALRVFERASMDTEVTRTRWALARVPLVEGRFEVAITKLRASRSDADRLGLTNVAAYITLDLVEALVATGANLQEVQKLCREVFATFKAAGMVNEALTALAYLREATRARTITTDKVRRVRRFLLLLEDQPNLRFDPLEG